MNEELMKEALIATFDERYNYPALDEIPEYTPSRKMNKKMKKLIKRQQKPYFVLIATPVRRFLCILVIVALIAIPILSVDSVRAKVTKFFINIFPTHNEININPEQMAYIDNLDEITPEYIEANLPEGFELVSSEEDEFTIIMEYRCGEDYIVYNKSIISNMSILNDNESAEYISYEDENGKEYMVYDSDGYEQISIYWFEGKYKNKIDSNLSKEEIFDIF